MKSLSKIKWLRKKKRNWAFRALLHPLKVALGDERFFKTFHGLPVLGKVGVNLPNGRRLYLQPGIKDRIATELYFHGLAGFEPETMELFC